jgi:hypothetical protein
MSPEPHSVLGIGKMPGNKEKAAGSVALFNHTDISRSDAEKIQCWTRLVRAAAAEKFQMLLVTVLFTENIDVSDGFWGLTKNADYIMYSTFLTASPGSVLFSRSTLLKRKDLCFSCLRLGLIRHRRSKEPHTFSQSLATFFRGDTSRS